jgi:hypothetical protein
MNESEDEVSIQVSEQGSLDIRHGQVATLLEFQSYVHTFIQYKQGWKNHVK